MTTSPFPHSGSHDPSHHVRGKRGRHRRRRQRGVRHIPLLTALIQLAGAIVSFTRQLR